MILQFPVGKIFAQRDSTDIYDLTLSQLSKLKISTVSKVEQSLGEIPSTIFVITASEIKEKGYFTLEETLSDLPGFQFRNILGLNSYVFQRGIPNQNNLTLILIDGVQVNELNSGGFYGGAQYNLSNVERIEVIYGPSSVFYGTNALTGIINIITKNALEKKGELGLLAGSFKTSKIDLSYCYANEEKTFGILASGMFKKSGKANLKESAGDNNWTNEMDNFEDDYSFDLKIQSGNFIGGTNILYKQVSTATLTKSIGTIYKDYGTSWNILFVNSYLKYHHQFSANSNLSSILYNRNATVLDNTIYSVVDTAQIGYYRPNNLTGLENVFNYNVDNSFSITSGLTFEYEQLAKKNSLSYSSSPFHEPPAPQKPEMLHNYLISLFIEPRITLYKNLYLSGGVRYDNSSVYNQVVTPRTGLSYHFDNHIFRVSYAEAFRAPKPWDYTDGLGNSSLLPERMKSLETAFTFSITDNYKLDLIGYRNILDKAIIKEVDNNGYRWINGGKVNTTGAELFLRYESRNMKSYLNYTFTQSYNEMDEFIPEISEHCGNLSVAYSFNKYLKVNLRANYIGERENPKIIQYINTKEVGAFLVFHGSVSFINYKGFDIQLFVKNILDTEYYHTSNRDPDRYRQPQRTIMFSVGYSLDN